MDSLTICKMALAEIGTRSTITSLTDGSEEAIYCNLCYTSVRDQALRSARWNFARHIDTITVWKALPGTPENPTPATLQGWQRSYPPAPWLYAYDIPSDFIQARSLLAQPTLSSISPPLYPIAGSTVAIPVGPRCFFELAVDHYDLTGAPTTPQRRVLLANVQTPLFEYTYRCTEEDLFDSEFVMVMVKAMAGNLAIALTQDKGLAQLKVGEANNLIMQARAADANEGLTILDHIPDWLSIRGVGGAYMSHDYYYPYGPLFSLPL